MARETFVKASLPRRAWIALRNPGRIWRGMRLTKHIRALRRSANGPLVLVNREAGIGDIICTFPATLALRKKHPGCIIVYATRHEFAPIVEMGSCADIVVGHDYKTRDPRIRPTDFDFVYAPKLPDEVPTPDRAHLHLVDEFSNQMGVAPVDRQPRLTLPVQLVSTLSTQLSAARTGVGPLIGIHIGPSWAVREWINSRWADLTAKLVTELQATVIQLGTDTDTARGEVDVERISGAVNWVNRLALKESIAAIKGLDLLVGIDSGLLHIAGAVGTRCVGIFGPIDASLRLPPATPGEGCAGPVPCLGCHHRLPRLHWRSGCPYNIACMQTLESETVFDACLRVLARPGNSGGGIDHP